MHQPAVFALLFAAVASPGMAQAASFDQGMNTMWEVLWHQSGTATRLVRWEQDLRVRISGVNAGAHRQHTLQALRDVAAEAGVEVIDVSDRPDAARQANVDIRIVADNALPEDQPCETRLDFGSETTIDSVSTVMRDSEAERCAYHESMHIMGVRGHPGGETVLSYFSPVVDRLLPLDRAMLRAWYSPRAHGGMTPFEVLPILADELVAIAPDKHAAAQARDRFLLRTVGEMQAFADGGGDVPGIVKRSGKSSDLGIRFGRMEMSYFLGVAYQKGTSVAKDATQAMRWMQHAASLGDRSAKALLAGRTTALGAGS